jgi:hypothetical protein
MEYRNWGEDLIEQADAIDEAENDSIGLTRMRRKE